MKNLIGHGVNYERIYGGESRRATAEPPPIRKSKARNPKQIENSNTKRKEHSAEGKTEDVLAHN
jgi:hypothetical protein